MSEHNKKVGKTPEDTKPTEDVHPHTNDNPTVGSQEPQGFQNCLTPFEEIGMQLAKVAEGGSMVELRETVRRVYPKTKEEANIMNNKLVRMRQAAESVSGLAMESFSALVN